LGWSVRKRRKREVSRGRGRGGLSGGLGKEETVEQVPGKIEGTCVGMGLKQKEETRQSGLEGDVEEEEQ